jgi:MFS family permease
VSGGIRTLGPVRASTRSAPLLITFGLFGVLWGTFAVTLADIARDLGMSVGALGLAASIGTIGSLPTMLWSGRLADRLGTGPLAAWSALGLGTGLLLIALAARGPVTLVASLFVLFAASGAHDVAINAAAVGFERARERPVMSYLHALFSLGGAASALGAGALLSAGLGFRAVLAGVGVALLALAAGLAVTGLPSTGQDTDRAGTLRLLASQPPLVLLAVVCAAVFLAEGAMEQWAAFYLRTDLAAPALLGSTGTALFHATMFTGRMVGGAVVARIGNLRALRWAGVLVVAGVLLAVATRSVPVVLAGFAVVGLALSTGFPVVLSLTGERVPNSTASAVAGVTMIGYAGFLFGPALIGGLAELTSLRAAFLVFVVTGGFMAVAAAVLGRAGSRGPAEAPLTPPRRDG